MYDILKKLAALADEADRRGHRKVADGIDGVIKSFAANAQRVDMPAATFVNMPEARLVGKVEKIDVPEEMTITGRVPAQKDQEVARQHESARKKMEQIAKLYTDAGKPVPFKVPAPGMTKGHDIMAFLEAAGMGGKLRDWSDMHSRLDKIYNEANAFTIDVAANPFSSKNTILAKK